MNVLLSEQLRSFSRDAGNNGALMREAADEIERLRGAIKSRPQVPLPLKYDAEANLFFVDGDAWADWQKDEGIHWLEALRD